MSHNTPPPPVGSTIRAFAAVAPAVGTRVVNVAVVNEDSTVKMISGQWAPIRTFVKDSLESRGRGVPAAKKKICCLGKAGG